MNAWPEARTLRAFLARASRRLVWIAAMEGAAAGIAVAVAMLLAAAAIGWPRGGSLQGAIIGGAGLVVAGLVIWLAIAMSRARRIASLLERRAPECRNILITAAELIERPAAVKPYMRERVCRDAVRVAQALDPSTIFPARRAFAALGTSTGLWALGLIVVFAGRVPPDRATGAPTDAAAINSVDITVAPPPYTARPEQALRDPTRIEVLAGSRVRIAVRADAATVAIETIGGRRPLDSDGPGAFAGEWVADADGYIAIEPSSSSGRAGVRRLIGVSVTPDLPPRVRLTAPGRDLLLPNATRTIDLTVLASDDLGLASLTVRYTKVSGSGERFEFLEGDLPLDISRSGDSAWTARGALRLAELGLAAGDMLVYRGVAADRRPGAPPSESDAWIVEIAAPGALATGGFSLDDTYDRYGLSQQMVILKTERLIARAPSLAAEPLAYEARTIAAEQRSVRAEFVFMMGGELAEEILAEASMEELDEAAHAEADDEVIAGRLANRGRLDLLRAIRSMSRANTALNNGNLDRALTEEKAALVSLEKAFSRTRYILRALTERERLDFSRRMTGVLLGAARDARPRVDAPADARVAALRRILADIASLAAKPVFGPDAAAGASRMAVNVLRVDPSAESLRGVASDLNAAALALSRTRTDEARDLLDRAALALVAAVRHGVPGAPGPASALELKQLDGARVDALRRRGGAR